MKKIALFGLSFTLVTFVFLSCSKDDGPTTTAPVNKAPSIAAQTFTALETIDANAVIGTVKATDADGDPLSFTLDTNSDNLFEITKQGALSLIAGKQLDFSAKAKHTLSVSVTDELDTSKATVTINVTEVVVENLAPEILKDLSEIVVLENISDIETIITVEAEDPEGEPLTFKIATNDNDLFEISDTGDLGLANDKFLDFETTTNHNILVTVNDGVNTVEVPIGIVVGDVPEAQPNDVSAFVTKWQVVDANTPIDIVLNNDFNYSFTINWGDGTVEEVSQESGGTSVEHEYSTFGDYTISIIGDFPAIFMADSSSQDNLYSIEQWGVIAWQSMYAAFQGCQNLEHNATDTPNLSSVTDTSFMFKDCSSFNANLSSWNMMAVGNMAFMFSDATSFNQSLGNWDISSATDMSSMLDNSGLSTANYEETLIGWSELNAEAGETQIPEQVTLGALGLSYCNGLSGDTQRSVLINDFGWDITDAGSVNCL